MVVTGRGKVKGGRLTRGNDKHLIAARRCHSDWPPVLSLACRELEPNYPKLGHKVADTISNYRCDTVQ